nr:retrotransposon protein [Tanacetum cinerariifolium]
MDGKVIGRGIRKKGLYVIKLRNKPEDKICLATIDENSTLWYRRLGHANMCLIQSLESKELVRKLPKLKFYQHICDAWKIRKQVHATHRAKNIVSPTRCLELLHMDLYGPSAVRSYRGNCYTLVIVDDYSRSLSLTIKLTTKLAFHPKGKEYSAISWMAILASAAVWKTEKAFIGFLLEIVDFLHFLCDMGRAAGLGFYQRNNRNSSHPPRRDTMEESLSKFIAVSAKRNEENSTIIKEIRASTDAAIRNQGASIKTLKLQIKQMSKVLQERGFRCLPSSTEINPKDQVKSISTATTDLSDICHMETSLYAISVPQHRYIFPKTIPFPRRLYNYCCDGLMEAHEVKILDAINHNLPQKKRSMELYLAFFINNVCFDKALVNLGASVSVLPFSTYINLGLGGLSHTRLTIELADRTIKQPRAIAENMLVRIGKFVFSIDFIILDIPKDEGVPLILR